MNNGRFNLAARLAAVPAALVSGAALAAPDVSAVVTEIEGTETAIVAVGGAVLIIIVTAMVFKWIKRAF